MMYSGVERQLMSKHTLPSSAPRELWLALALVALPAIMIMQPHTVSKIPTTRAIDTRSVPSIAAASIVKIGCDGCQRDAVTAPASCTPIKLNELPVCRKRTIKKKRAASVVTSVRRTGWNGTSSSSVALRGRGGSPRVRHAVYADETAWQESSSTDVTNARSVPKSSGCTVSALSPIAETTVDEPKRVFTSACAALARQKADGIAALTAQQAATRGS
mmetsp:Transcript_9754/g.23562  ORF Transcript_9754/g.23562 Transcript_9754/m.23562 type:complete len:217 (-) Transcript_9754:1-651(-)